MNKKNRVMSRALIILFLFTTFFTYLTPEVARADITINDLAVQAVQNQYASYQDGTAVNGGGYTDFSSYDAYILDLAGADINTWVYDGTSLKTKVLSLIDATISNPSETTTDWSGKEVYVKSAKRVAQDYLAAKSLGETAKASQLLAILKSRQTASGYFDDSAFSDIPAFELLGRTGDIAEINTSNAITYILANRDNTSGAWTPAWNDFQTTAQAVRALYYLKNQPDVQPEVQTTVQTAIDGGLDWMKGLQKDDGSFQDAAGFDYKIADTAEVIYTLRLLGIDPASWVTAGKSPVDYMMEKALVNGSFGNIGCTTSAIDVYLQLGGRVADNTVLGVHVSPDDAEINVNGTQQYTAQAYRINGDIVDVSNSATWSTENAGIATINGSGLLTGIAAGDTVVKAVYEGRFDSADVTIKIYEVNDLVSKAAQNQYASYQDGTAVNGGGYTDFSSYDAYILDLAGADINTWVYDGTSLKTKVLSLIDATISNPSETTTDWSGKEVYVKSAKRVAQDYLAAKSLGETAKASQLLAILKSRQTASGYFDDSAFSDIPAFELLGRTGDIAEINTSNAITYILANRDNTSGAWTPAWNDFQTTAQAVRALYYLKNQPDVQPEVQTTVQTAIDGGLDWMKGLQKDDGSFQDAAGFDYKIADTAEVIYTLRLLGIDPASWVTAGKSPVDYMMEKALVNGSFGNIGCTTSAIDVYLQLGGRVADNTVLGVHVSPDDAEINVNGTQQYTAQAYRINGDIVDVSNSATWSTENAGIATINGSGLLTGIARGSVDVLALYEDVEGTARVMVSGTGDAGGQLNYTTVLIAVVGKDGNLIYGPSSVQISSDDEFGLTAMSALDATGLSWSFRSGEDGFIEEINGEANEGSNGWCGKVNNTSFWDVPKEISVSEGNKVIFWYSIDANFSGPNWNNLLSGNLSQATIPTTTKDEIKETLNSYREVLGTLINNTNPEIANELKILNSSDAMTKEEAQTLKEELDSNKVALSQEIGRTEAVLGDTEVSVLLPQDALSQTTTITIKELSPNQAAQQFGIKVGSSTYEFGPSGTKFDEAVTISIKIPITEDLNLESLAPAWYDEQSKQWIPIPGIIDFKTGLVVFRIDHFTKFALINLPDRVKFKDVDEEMIWAQDAIEILAGKGIIKGTGEGIFEPQRSISRAEFIQLVVTALQLKTDDYKNSIFSDVDSSDWFAASVASAYNNKIVSGYPDGTFDPNNSISRNEIASILHHLQGANTIDDVDLEFQDFNSIPAWASDGIKYVYKQGLMNGYADGTFKGDNPLSRAEAAVVIYKHLNMNTV